MGMLLMNTLFYKIYLWRLFIITDPDFLKHKHEVMVSGLFWRSGAKKHNPDINIGPYEPEGFSPLFLIFALSMKIKWFLAPKVRHYNFNCESCGEKKIVLRIFL